MRRIVIGTNLHVDCLNAGRHEAALFQRDAVKYLSSIGEDAGHALRALQESRGYRVVGSHSLVNGVRV